jgi:hypothetical protein
MKDDTLIPIPGMIGPRTDYLQDMEKKFMDKNQLDHMRRASEKNTATVPILL